MGEIFKPEDMDSEDKIKKKAEKLADRLSSPAKIIRARRATVLRFLKRRCGRHRNQPVP